MAATEGDVSDDSTQQPMVGSDKSIGFRQARGMASPAIALRPCNSRSISAECFGADQCHPLTGKRGHVACTGPKTGSTRCQDRIRFLSASFALGALLFTAVAGSSVVTCGNTQKVSVADGKSWRCQADLQANHAAKTGILTAATCTPNYEFDFRQQVSHDSPEHFAGFADEASTRAYTRARG